MLVPVFLAALVAGATVGYETRFANAILPGVKVGGVDLSGLDRSTAEARLLAAFSSPPQGRVTVITRMGPHVIPYAELARRPDVERMLDEAFRYGRGADLVGRVQQAVHALQKGAPVAPRVVIDEQALAAHVASLADSALVPARDAAATVEGGTFRLEPGSDGYAVRATEVAAAVRAAASQAVVPNELSIDAVYERVGPRLGDEQVRRAVVAAERMTAADLRLVLGTETWTIPRETVRTWVRFGQTAGGYRPTVSARLVKQAMTGFARRVSRKPVEASLVVRRGRITATGRSRDGRRLDVAVSVGAVVQALNRRAVAPASGSTPVMLAVRAVRPRLSSSAARKLAPRMVRLSTWTTRFTPSESNGFGANITIPARAIDGLVVLSGAKFDFWDAIGPVTRKRGYRDGGAIINGRSQPTGALGGGICSTSTTLFNTVARAGLDIVARRAHFYYIDRYPVGLDATVFISSSGSRITLAFVNDTSAPVMIRSFTTRTTVRFDLYGIPDGRSVKFSRPIVRNVKRAREVTRVTSQIAPGTRQRIEYPTDGFDSWVTRTVTDKKSRVLHRDTFVSRYSRVDGLTLVGASR